jgi:hypothetical protein
MEVSDAAQPLHMTDSNRAREIAAPDIPRRPRQA